MVFHWSLSDSTSPQIFGTPLSIMADLNYSVSIRPLISKSSSHCTKPLVTVPSAPFLQLVSPSLSYSVFFFFFSSQARIITTYILILTSFFPLTLTSFFLLKSTWQVLKEIQFLLRFPFRYYFQVFSYEILPVCRSKFPCSCFSPHFFYLIVYLPTPLVRQDMTQDQFLSGI